MRSWVVDDWANSYKKDISTIGGQAFISVLSNLYCACTETANSLAVGHNLTLSLHLATRILYKTAIIWRSPHRCKICHICIWSILPNDNSAAPCSIPNWDQKFEVGQPIRSWLITFSLQLRYVTLELWPLTLWPWTCVVSDTSESVLRVQNKTKPLMTVWAIKILSVKSSAQKHKTFWLLSGEWAIKQPVQRDNHM